MDCCDGYFAPLGWYQRAHQISRLPGTSYQSRPGHVPPCLSRLIRVGCGQSHSLPPHTKCHPSQAASPIVFFSPFPASASSRDHQMAWPGLDVPLRVALLQCALTSIASITHCALVLLTSVRQPPSLLLLVPSSSEMPLSPPTKPTCSSRFHCFSLLALGI